MARMMALAALAAFALGAEPEPKAEAPPKAAIRGVVKTVTGVKIKGLVGRMMVEGMKEKDTGYDKASVSILTGAKFYFWKDGKKEEAKFKDIVRGCVVQCDFTGKVLESYPVQARTMEVLILSVPKKK
jgi:hypothetical protein